jgi:hypothetical protein
MWIVLVTKLSAVLHAGSLVSCHNFLSLFSCRKWPKTESALFGSESVSLHVGSLYVEAVEALKAVAAFSASSAVSVWIRGGIK